MMDMLLFITAAAHLFYTPFTKVEESFNLQAMHDILYYRHNFSQYDHHDFPGVVPRTFLGPLVISILSTPFIILFEALRINKFWAQYVVRLMLAAVISAAWHNLRRVITKIFNVEVRLWFTIITLTQFHFMFYMSRPLPNIMALPLVLYALAYWLRGQTKPFIICSGIVILIFRSELLIFLGLLLLFDLIQKRTTIDAILRIAIPAGVVILATTLILDSLFWQRILWPEGSVLWYNTILNKSSNWGTSPFLWYFYSALPRALGASLIFVPIGMYLEPRIRPIVLAAIGFIFIYSLLPHKELRFIIYVFPVLNLAAACACHRFWINRSKSWWRNLLAICAGGHLCINVLITLFLLIISGTNYPGGVALTRLHRLEAHTPNVSVHIANLAAQSGVSRFMQFRDDWSYCKKEHLNYTHEETMQYTHLLVEARSKHNNQLWTTLQEDFETLEFVDCFNSIGIQYNSLLPVRVKTKPCVGILKRRKGAKVIKKAVVDRGLDITEKNDTNLNEEIETLADEPAVKEKLFEETEIHEKSTEIHKKSAEIKGKSAKTLVTVPIAEQHSEEYIKPADIPLSPSPIIDSEELYDGIVDNYDEGASLEMNASLEEADSDADAAAAATHTKEINFHELRNLALGQVTRKTKATKLKIRKLIEQHYRSKGRHIESDSLEYHDSESRSDKRHSAAGGGGSRQTVKSIIKQERIKDMIEQIATMDLTRICDLEHVSTKECLKQVIDKMDEDTTHHT